MFDDIAPKYDRTNTVLSLGLHRGWRRAAVRRARIQAGQKVLDIATGTGDLAFAFRRKGADVVALDFSEEMLRQARRKQAGHRNAPESPAVRFLRGDAMALPFPDDHFDVASISFGIRNVDEPEHALAEMARVVRPGGRVVVLEFGKPNLLMRGPYKLYSKIMPWIGTRLTGNREAYEYLPKTVANFPSGRPFVDLMHSAAEFSTVTARPMSGGVAWLYVAIV